VQSDGSLKLPRGGVRLTLWNRAASSGHAFWQNLYGSHPFFLQVAQGEWSMYHIYRPCGLWSAWSVYILAVCGSRCTCGYLIDTVW
jgi:hypothetical protein